MQCFKSLQSPFIYRFLTKELRRSFSSENKTSDELLNALQNLKLAQKPGSIIEIKNDVISFRNPTNSPLQYYRVVQGVDDSALKGLVVSVQESVSSALLFGPAKQIKVNDEVKSTQESIKVPFDINLSGKILDYLSRDIQKLDEAVSTEDYQELFAKQKLVNPFKKSSPKGQIFTGNIAIDLTDPIPMGSFAYFRGNTNTGKTLMAVSTIHQFLSNNYFSPRSAGLKKAIYVNINSNTTQNVAKHLSELDMFKDTFLFTNKMGFHRSTEDYLLPYTALAYAQELKRRGYDVLLIIDEIQEHLMKEILIFNTAKIPVLICPKQPPYNIVHEVFQECGYYEKGSVTAVVIKDSNTANPQYTFEIQQQDNLIASLANVIINFDLGDKDFKKEFPKVNFKITPSSYRFRHFLLNHINKSLAKLLEEVRNQKNMIANRKEYKIHYDPWDAYLYFDSQYFMRLLISSNRYNIIEQLIIVQVVLQAVETDTISLFKEEPEIFIQDLFRFAAEYKEFEKKDIYSYIEAIISRGLPPEEVTETIVQSINRFYEMFQVWCKVNNKLLAFKKDYTD